MIPAAAVSPTPKPWESRSAAAAGQAPAYREAGHGNPGYGGHGFPAGPGAQPWLGHAPGSAFQSLARIELRAHMHRDLDEVSYLFHLGVIDVHEANAWLTELWDRYSAAELDLRDWEAATGCG